LSRLFAPKRLEGNSYQLEADVSMPDFETKTNYDQFTGRFGEKRQPNRKVLATKVARTYF